MSKSGGANKSRPKQLESAFLFSKMGACSKLQEQFFAW